MSLGSFTMLYFLPYSLFKQTHFPARTEFGLRAESERVNCVSDRLSWSGTSWKHGTYLFTCLCKICPSIALLLKYYRQLRSLLLQLVTVQRMCKINILFYAIFVILVKKCIYNDKLSSLTMI